MPAPLSSSAPVSIDDPVNRRILAVSEDRITGFHRRPFAQIAERSGVDLDTVVARIGAMLKAGTIRRVRQTLLATNLARGALVAWRLPPKPGALDAAFDWMHTRDPFTGHVVIRSTDQQSPGAAFRLWTTVKVPQGFSLQKHCASLARRIGAEAHHRMPAKRLFKLGVGHVRRRRLEVGAKSDQPAEAIEPRVVKLTGERWRVLDAIKRALTLDEIAPDPWTARAGQAGFSIERFCAIAATLNELGVIGRFSTFLEHVKPLADGKPVTRYNGLFHWTVPEGLETEAGRQVGRFDILTHAYWRPAGEAFGNVNIMAVAHGTDRQTVLAHKRAIDDHLASCGIEPAYTNVFWGGRSEIKPSEISPEAYRRWCEVQGLDPASMAEQADIGHEC